MRHHLFALGALLLTACAAGDDRFVTGDPAGFWFGLWHGFIVPVTFVVGLFDGSVEIYERVNNGAWYDFGFLLGVLGLGGCGHQSHRRWRGSTEAVPKRAHVKIDVDWSGEDDDARPAPPATPAAPPP